MNEKYERIFCVGDDVLHDQVMEAIKGLDAMVVETTYDQARVYFYVLIDPKDKAEFDRRLDAH